MATKQAGARANSAPNGNGLSVLLICPDVDLPNADGETQRIINALHPQVLLGTVTTSDVLDAVQAAQYDVVWFLGHSGPNGLQLSDGILSPAHLAQILRQSPPRLVVLNSCSSLMAAMQVHDDIQAAVICTVLDVPDLDAYVTGASLANALAQGLDIAQAYQVSRPSANRQYILLNGSLALNGASELDDLKRLISRTSAEQHGEIAGMARAVGNMQRQLSAIQQEQERVRVELQTGPDRYAATLTRVRALAFAVGLAFIGGAIGVLEFRDVIDVSPVAAALFATFVLGVAGWLLLYGVGFRWDK